MNKSILFQRLKNLAINQDKELISEIQWINSLTKNAQLKTEFTPFKNACPQNRINEELFATNYNSYRMILDQLNKTNQACLELDGTFVNKYEFDSDKPNLYLLDIISQNKNVNQENQESRTTTIIVNKIDI
ncbi:hypothetical protein [Mycoplasma nasistruthionis]|uniref:Uncharacterized protein n=1 Tax=Mycoplasma nasistruthionis TaxID=353852 RepID=A0A5B7XVP9_9MOLU|nr:hypothetical protein [Mycoplasma nasistruthionis]QCZ36938.1 hypothetical protein FG904_02910 [Mycoplasma nasistruthionis]